MLLPSRASILVALFVALGATPHTMSQTPAVKPEANASVSGKVTIKGKPFAGIVVGMHLDQPNESSPTYKATTDEDGVYHINNVAKGTYTIAPVAPAMVVANATDPNGVQLVIGGADGIDGMDFDLVRGGVITGRVTDAEGHPIIANEITLTPVEQPNQRPTYQRLPGGQTDDRGIYRIFGIRAGRYKVAVGAWGGSVRGGRPPVPLTYYPDAREASKAGFVDVDEGGEAAKIDIKIGSPLRMFTVSGRVIESENGKPVPNVSVSLSHIIIMDEHRTHSVSNDDSGARTDRDGRFKVANVVSGKYELSIYAEDADFRPQGPIVFEVPDADVTDVTVKTVRGAQVSGVLVFEGNRKDLAARTYVIVYVKDERGGSSSNSALVKPDGSFAVGGLMPGTLSFSVAIGGGSQGSGAKLMRLEREGVVQPNAIPMEATGHITGLRLFVAFSSGSISGVVKVINGTLPPDTRLFVEFRRTDEATPYMGPNGGPVDARGHVLFEGLTPGTYQVTLQGSGPDPRVRIPTVKQLVTVTEGAVSEITLTLDLALSPIP